MLDYDKEAERYDATRGGDAAGLRTQVASTTFTSLGQGRTPGQWLRRLASGRVPWTRFVSQDRMTVLYAALAALPGQDRPRPDPVFSLIALRKQLSAALVVSRAASDRWRP